MGQRTTLLNFHTQLPLKGTFSLAELDPGAQHHLKVLRIRSGEEFRFIDGQGSIVDTRCTQLRPPVFEILNLTQSPKLYPAIELCLAAPKGDLLWETITQATEVGVTSIRLMRSDFVQYTKQQEAPTLRAQKVSDAACEQCARAWRVQVQPGWHRIEDCLALGGPLICADESLSTAGVYGFADKKNMPPLDPKQPIRLFIGPEGGWSAPERVTLSRSTRAFGLGPLVLRVPTATVAALQLIRSMYADKK